MFDALSRSPSGFCVKRVTHAHTDTVSCVKKNGIIAYVVRSTFSCLPGM